MARLVKRDASITDVAWGLGCVVVGCTYFAAGDGWWTLTSPMLMTLTLLEKKLEQTKPAYREYVHRTSAFCPWWPADRAKPDTVR